MKSVQHWGTFQEAKRSSDVPNITADVEKSMSNICLAEYNIADDENETENVSLQTMDPLMIYAISLHKHANDMVEMIQVAELAIETNLITPDKAALSIPEMPNINRKHIQNCLNFMTVDSTDFTDGQPVNYPEISTDLSTQILTKCVATMFAHIGYETTHESVLLLLTDVLEMFLRKISKQMKSESENELVHGLGGFPSYPEKVFIQAGLGGMKGLHGYYQNRVLKYINVLRKRSLDLIDHYEKLLLPQPDNEPESVNPDEDLDILAENGAEMHISSIDANVGLSTLAMGYQLLNSLEAETNLGDEDATGSGLSLPIINKNLNS